MIVRCGACQNQFDVPGEGTYSCPVCATPNAVRSAHGGAVPHSPPTEAMPPTAPSGPSPRVSCSECGFSFIVGAIDVATCPNCNAEVHVGSAEESESEDA